MGREKKSSPYNITKAQISFMNNMIKNMIVLNNLINNLGDLSCE